MASREELKAQYPQLGWLIDNPEIAPLFEQAYAEGWTAERFQAAVQATNWWRTSSEASRHYQSLQGTDPGEFQATLAETNQEIRSIAVNMGYGGGLVNDAHFDWMANTAMSFGIKGAALQRFVADNLAQAIDGVPSSAVRTDLYQMAASYGVDLDETTVRSWFREINAGRSTMDNFRSQMIEQAKALMPSLSEELDKGMTLDQITNPYRSQIAEMMEIDPGTINFMRDPKWRNVVAYVDPKTGATRKMSAVEMAKYVREQPEWRKTKNALDSAAEIGERLLESFGAVSR
ncbi:MAG TPA: hypothetical protein VMZ51_08195 [Acidimicrobiales bacterium]|nr:hypothetical protein [Acidimicrobiales bacterium]